MQVKHLTKAEFSDLPLFQEPPPAQPIRPADPRVRGTVEEPRLSRQAQAILDRLRQGPATNAQLVQIAQRFGARLHDLREAGYQIEITDRDRETGLTTYAMVSP